MNRGFDPSCAACRALAEKAPGDDRAVCGVHWNPETVKALPRRVAEVKPPFQEKKPRAKKGELPDGWEQAALIAGADFSGGQR